MKNIVFLFWFLLAGLVLSAQNDEYLTQWPKDVIAKANTAKDVSYLDEAEKQVILYMNLARIDGKLFVKTFVKKYETTHGSDSYLKSLKETLNNQASKPVFQPSQNLSKAADYHAKDMGQTGKIGHQSSNGTKTFDRIRKYAKGGYMAENCSYGFSDAYGIVMQLLVDKGVPSLGHRKSILSTNYKAVGVAIRPHKTYRFNCVQDFSDTL